jgi:hypothetical protein
MTVKLSLLQAADLPVHSLVGPSLEEHNDVIFPRGELRLAEVVQEVSASAVAVEKDNLSSDRYARAPGRSPQASATSGHCCRRLCLADACLKYLPHEVWREHNGILLLCCHDDCRPRLVQVCSQRQMGCMFFYYPYRDDADASGQLHGFANCGDVSSSIWQEMPGFSLFCPERLRAGALLLAVRPAPRTEKSV